MDGSGSGNRYEKGGPSCLGDSWPGNNYLGQPR